MEAASSALYAHQREGIDFLLSCRSGILAFEQGLGKTLVAIEAFRGLCDRGDVRSLVVICPNSLKGNWRTELSRFAPELAVHTFSGPAPRRRRELWESKADVYLISYETARNEITSIRALLLRFPSVLVLDESHYVKNWRSLNSIASRQLAPCTSYRWLLTGTPVTNSPEDIYPQMSLVADPNPLGSYPSFIARFGERTLSEREHERLRSQIAPHILRRTKDECLDLPEKTFVDVRITLPAWQRRLYDDMRDRFVCEVEGMTADEFRCFAPTALARVLRLSQLASNPRLLFPGDVREPGKFVEIDRMIEDLVVRGGRKVILWSYYVGTVEELLRRCGHLGAVSIYGAVESESRIRIAEQFQTDPDTRVLVANPAAAGTGFTLTAATYAIYETLTWRYDLYAQSQDRNHRIGQESPVVYLRLIAEDTIEEAIVQALARKEAMARDLVGDEPVERLITEMGPAAFCAMLKTGHFPSELQRPGKERAT